jgi:hypothetical protein
VPSANGAIWKSVTVPPFIKKYAGATLGDMAPKDVIWWATNYEPRPYKGSISPKDVAFKAALVAGATELTAQAEAGVQADAHDPKRSKITADMEANVSDANPPEDVPF